jgi:hypothetical protein
MEAPKDGNEAMYGPQSKDWIPSMASEIMNFLSQKCWKKVPRSIPRKTDHTIMKTMWQFKNRHKSRACAKGYEQVPGKDYTESFSPVAKDSSVRAGIVIYLFHADGHDGLKYVCEFIAIEAAFLEGEIDKATYIEWPTGMLELRFITQEEFDNCCILLLKLMYESVDAALKCFRTYKCHLLKMMGYKPSLADNPIYRRTCRCCVNTILDY